MLDNIDNFSYKTPEFHIKDIDTISKLLELIFPPFAINGHEIEPNHLTHNGNTFYQNQTHCFLSKTPLVELVANNNELTTITVNKYFIQIMVHGIQSLGSFDSKRTPQMMAYKINHLKNTPHQKNSPIGPAANFFLEALKQSTKWYSTPKEAWSENTRSESCINIASKFRELLKTKKTASINALIENITTDIYLLNSEALLKLDIPVAQENPDHLLTFNFNRLVRILLDDFTLSLKNPKLLLLKLQVYLEVAHKLIGLKDYHGAGIIHFVFNTMDKEIDGLMLSSSFREKLEQLNQTYSMLKNFPNLRHAMSTNPGVPYFPLLSKDLLFANEGASGNLLNIAEVYGKIHFHLAQQKMLVAQVRQTMPCEYQTNLIALIKNEPQEEFESETLTLSSNNSNKESLESSKKAEKHAKKIRSSKRYSIPLNLSTHADNAEEREVYRRRSTIQSLALSFKDRFFESPRHEDDTLELVSNTLIVKEDKITTDIKTLSATTI